MMLYFKFFSHLKIENFILTFPYFAEKQYYHNSDEEKSTKYCNTQIYPGIPCIVHILWFSKSKSCSMSTVILQFQMKYWLVQIDCFLKFKSKSIIISVVAAFLPRSQNEFQCPQRCQINPKRRHQQLIKYWVWLKNRMKKKWNNFGNDTQRMAISKFVSVYE